VDDVELEELFRGGLQRRADEVDTAVDLLGLARAGTRGQRRRRWAVGGVAGVAAAALVTAVVLQDPSTPERPGGDDDTAVVDEGSQQPLPNDWRVETWHGLSVEVPADWGWGTAPMAMSFDRQSRLLCGGPGAMVRADGKKFVNPERGIPWVGRPVMLSDDCLGGTYPAPVTPYVWLGADLPVGTVDVGDGYTQETVGVAGTTVTVATRDADLRQRILGSAGPTASGCAPSLVDAPVVESMLMEGLRDPSSARVCAYRRERGAAAWDLVYATTLDAQDAAAYHAQVYDGGREWSPDFCEATLDERVLVTIVGKDPYGGGELTQDTVIDPRCEEVSGSPGMVSPLSPAGMKAWSRNGAQASLNSFNGWLG
jgi:hypothetical protein